MNKPANLQDLMLNTLRKEKSDVTVFLTNGFQESDRPPGPKQCAGQ